MEREPKPTKSGLYLVTVKEFKFVLLYTRTKRGQRNYVVAWPQTDIAGDWETCMIECELYAVQHSTRIPRRNGRGRRRS